MAISINIKDERGPSNEMCRQLQPNKTKVMTVLAVNIAAKAFYALYITKKTEHFSFKMGFLYSWQSI